MDIRNFFGAKGASKPVVSSKDNKEKKKKRNVISDSDDSDEDFAAKSKKTVKVTPPPATKPQGSSSKSAPPPKPQMKETTAADFFGAPGGSKPTKSGTTPAKKRKESTDEESRDQAFSKTLSETDFPSHQKTKKQRTTSPEAESKKTSSLAGKLAAQLLTKTEAEQKTPSKTVSPDKQLVKSPSKTISPDKKLVKSPSKTISPDKKLIKTPTGAKTILVASPLANTELNDSVSEVPGTPQEAWEEKKKERQATYKKFLTRGGAKNPGSKVVPEGSPNCLKDLVFVLTGVFDSLEREEMGEIIKRLGGKVTTSLSKNTKYMVAGEEAGASKLDKARSLGTKQLTEDEFLDLIREKTVKEKENKTPETSPVKTEEKVSKKETPKKEPKKEPKADKSVEIKKVESVLSTKESPITKKEEKYIIPKGSPKKEKLEVKVLPKLPAPEQPRGSPSKNLPTSSTLGEVDLWVDKYKPGNTKAIIGQQGDKSNMNKLKIWLRDWNKNHLGGGKKAPKPAPWGAANDAGAWAKCALLSGPPGVGKTTTAYLVSTELGFDVVEMNASDTRSKKLLTGSVSDLLNTTSVANMVGAGRENEKVTSKRVLLMDEVDGMAGNEDRGGIAELILLMKTSKVPVIAMCNDRNHQKIRSLANHCFDLRFQRPRVEQIRAAMMSVCFKEKIQIKPDALSELITGCNQDVRQVLHHLSMVKAGNNNVKMEAGQAKKEAEMAKKTSIKVGPWDVCRQVFSAEDHKKMSLFDKSDLYFHDYNLAGLFVAENYLSSKPAAAGGDKKKLMQLVSKAADSIAEGDLFEKGIRSGMNWSLLPSAAMFCSVVPGTLMSGFMTGQIQFPSWLGKNSKRTKVDRIMSELQSHTRLSAGAAKQAMVMDYGQRLRTHLVSPLVTQGAEGVEQAVERMGDYSLLREDLDGLLEATQWPDRPDAMKDVDSKTKAAFTRRYNKEGVNLPYAVQQAVNKRKAAPATEDAGWGEEEGDDVEEDEGSDVENDAMIKKKQKTSKVESKASKGSKAGSTKGASKSAVGKAKGKK